MWAVTSLVFIWIRPHKQERGRESSPRGLDTIPDYSGMNAGHTFRADSVQQSGIGFPFGTLSKANAVLACVLLLRTYRILRVFSS
jgi:hypothetical protein